MWEPEENWQLSLGRVIGDCFRVISWILVLGLGQKFRQFLVLRPNLIKARK